MYLSPYCKTIDFSSKFCRCFKMALASLKVLFTLTKSYCTCFLYLCTCLYFTQPIRSDDMRANSLFITVQVWYKRTPKTNKEKGKNHIFYCNRMWTDTVTYEFRRSLGNSSIDGVFFVQTVNFREIANVLRKVKEKKYIYIYIIKKTW